MSSVLQAVVVASIYTLVAVGIDLYRQRAVGWRTTLRVDAVPLVTFFVLNVVWLGILDALRLTGGGAVLAALVTLAWWLVIVRWLREPGSTGS